MSDAAHDRAKAAELPEGDVIRVLLEQHAHVRELFTAVRTAGSPELKQQSFDELRALLAMHETAEEMVLRPKSRQTAGEQVADARNQEEAEANEVLAHLERLDIEDAEFDTQFADFEKSVDHHAEAEEREEFPAILAATDEKERQHMGSVLQAVEKTAPTHPHPSTAGSTPAQWALGPFASMVDHARDAVKHLMSA